MKPLVTDLNELRRVAAERHETFEAMREALEYDDTFTDDALNELVESIAAPIAAAIDCKQCANCCRSLDVCLVPNDIDRLSAAIHVSIDDIVERYADEELGQKQGEWAVIPVKPCPFLGGNLCTIYEHRPHACRVYPQFTPDFRYNLEDTIEGASTCPIIYNVLNELIERVEMGEDKDD